MQLSNAPLFRGIEEADVEALLRCMGGQTRAYQKGEVIMAEGTVTEHIGLVLSGTVILSCSDVGGNLSVWGRAVPGETFAEVYACIPGQPLLVTASAAEDTSVLLVHAGRIVSPCNRACPFHAGLARNLLTVCAQKSLQLSQKIRHTHAKSIRGRLTSYFSECAKRAGGPSFQIPYNRQQLADYLNVERSAMCNELSKMRKEGLIAYSKNQFHLQEPWTI